VACAARCDGRDFFDNEEVVFERFASDWQLALRLGLVKLITENDDGGVGDTDGDGIPDEVEDVSALLFQYNQLWSTAYLAYADAVYGAGDDLDTGMKENEGWKAFTEDIKVWSSINLSVKDASQKNNLIFMSIDKWDKPTQSAIAAQTPTRSKKIVRDVMAKPMPPMPRVIDEEASHEYAHMLDSVSKAALDAMKEPANQLNNKKDLQLSRVEFVVALIKVRRAAPPHPHLHPHLSPHLHPHLNSHLHPHLHPNARGSVPVSCCARHGASRLRSTPTPTQPPDLLRWLAVRAAQTAIERFVKTKQINDVSDSVLKLLSEHIAPAIHERAPPPDAFRVAVCYTPEMSRALEKHAPALRVIFGGLSLIAFMLSKTHPPKLPKPKESKKLKRDDGSWIKVHGLISLSFWRACAARSTPRGGAAVRAATPRVCRRRRRPRC
jgi:hypothetical protein